MAHLPLFGPTFGTYDELAVIASSGISPDSIPSGLSQVSETKRNNYKKNELSWFYFIIEQITMVL